MAQNVLNTLWVCVLCGLMCAGCVGERTGEPEDASGTDVLQDDTNTSSDTSTPAPCGDVVCTAAEICCDQRCVEPNTDPSHCGACGAMCEAPGTCQGGNCLCDGSICAPGEGCCEEDGAPSCAAGLNTNPQHCGGCGITCALGELCTEGACVCENNTGAPEACREDETCCPNLGCIALADDVMSCGACGLACNPGETCNGGFCTCGGGPACSTVNASPACVSGACQAICNAGFGDCDNTADTGCEIDISADLNNCGSCGVVCPTPRSSRPTCDAGVCGYTCDDDFGDCDGSADSGCETALLTSAENCGACGRACITPPNASPKCDDGGCGFSCQGAFSDCDTNPDNGCEANTQTDRQNCGSCGNTCQGNDTCEQGVCTRPVVYANWLVGTPCNGTDHGGGCTSAETGYHWKGIYNNHACWWHTKNQAWNTTTATNTYSLALQFGLDPTTGGNRWCEPFSNTPSPPYSNSYQSSTQIGAWGWCGGTPFSSGGWVCFAVP